MARISHEQILVCRAVDPPSYVVLGSLPMKCHECNKAVWVSPSSMLILHDNPEMQIKCISCAFAHIAPQDITPEDLTQAQLEEIEEYHRSEKQ